MNSLFKGLIDWLRSTYYEPTVAILKVRAAIWYLEAIRSARRILMLVCALVFVITLIGAGLVLIPVALLIFMPWEPMTKAYVGLAFGVVYLLVPIISLSILLSEKRWMETTGANELLRKL